MTRKLKFGMAQAIPDFFVYGGDEPRGCRSANAAVPGLALKRPLWAGQQS